MKVANDGRTRHLENTRLALRLWKERVKPDEVVPALGAWRCGTQACFGGHLATWPEFQAKGVRIKDNGSPEMDVAEAASDVSYILFGNYALFSIREAWVPTQGLKDYELVIARLEWNIETLENSRA